MSYKITNWEFSNETDMMNAPVEEGRRYLYINHAMYEPDIGMYTLYLTDLTSEVEFSIRYRLNKADPSGNIIPNTWARGTLVTLGKALFGGHVGIPAPGDVIGGVVIGEVSVKTYEGSDRSFPRIFTYYPAPEDIVSAYSKIDQYSEASQEAEE